MNEKEEAKIAWTCLSLMAELERNLWNLYFSRFLDMHQNGEINSRFPSPPHNDSSE